MDFADAFIYEDELNRFQNESLRVGSCLADGQEYSLVQRNLTDSFLFPSGQRTTYETLKRETCAASIEEI